MFRLFVKPLVITLSLVFSANAFVHAQQLPPASVLVGQPYQSNDGSLFDNAFYIGGFKCLAEGKNWQWDKACEYYQADISLEKLPNKSASKICLKELTRVSYPRQYSSEKMYRLNVDISPHEYVVSPDGAPLGHILSEAPIPASDERLIRRFLEPSDSQWHDVTMVLLYNCETPYDGKSYN